MSCSFFWEPKNSKLRDLLEETWQIFLVNKKIDLGGIQCKILMLIVLLSCFYNNSFHHSVHGIKFNRRKSFYLPQILGYLIPCDLTFWTGVVLWVMLDLVLSNVSCKYKGVLSPSDSEKMVLFSFNEIMNSLGWESVTLLDINMLHS